MQVLLRAHSSQELDSKVNEGQPQAAVGVQRVGRRYGQHNLPDDERATDLAAHLQQHEERRGHDFAPELHPQGFSEWELPGSGRCRRAFRPRFHVRPVAANRDTTTAAAAAAAPTATFSADAATVTTRGKERFLAAAKLCEQVLHLLPVG